MKKGLFVLILVVVGMILGFLVGQNVAPIEKLKIVKERIVDTVYKSKIIEVPVLVSVEKKENKEVVEKDTVENIIEIDVVDSIVVIEVPEEDDDSLQIKKDEKLKVESLKLIIIKQKPVDTLLQKLLKVETVNQRQIIVEYWESPVNYKGYKFSKSKLIVYGVKPLTGSAIYKNESLYYFKANNIFYELVESADFKSMVTIPKPALVHD